MVVPRIVFILLLSGVFFAGASGQAFVRNTFAYINYSTDDGLPGNETYSVLEDSEGYIWIGTDRGVARYNGHEFTIYTSNDGLPDNTIFEFYEDHKGRIWFYSFNGKIGYWFHDRFYQLEHGANIDQHRISGIHVSPEDSVRIYFGNYNGPWMRFSMNENHIDRNSLEYGNSNNIPVDENDSSTTESYIDRIMHRFHRNAQAFRRRIKHGQTGLIRVAPNRFAARIGSRHVYVLDTGFHKVLAINDTVQNGRSITRMAAHKGYWFITYSDGSIEEYTRQEPITRLRTIHVPDGYVPSYISRDRFGGLWVTTLNKGVLYAPATGMTARPFSQEIIDGGLKLYRRNEQIEVVVNNIHELHIIQRNGTQEARKISLGANVQSMNHHDGLFTVTTTNSALILTSDGQVLEERNSAPAGYYDALIDDGELISCAKRKIHFDGVSIEVEGATRLVSLELQGDTIWMAGMNGLFAFSRSSKVQIPVDGSSLLSNRINRLKLLDDNLLMTTRGAGILIRNRSGVYQITEADGLVSNSTSQLVTDGNRTLWISSNRGISKIVFDSFSPVDYTIENLGREDGLLSGTISDLQLYGDSLYILSNDVLHRMHKDYEHNPVQPEIRLTGLKVDNKPVRISERLEFSHSDNNLTFEYFGFYYPNPTGLRYAYSIDGGQTWTETKSRTINFHNLSPGEYSLQLRASTPKGVKSDVKRIAFTIAPPFWQTWWFYGVVAIVVLSTIFMIVRARLNRVRRESRIRTELAQLESKALSAQMNPHFVFNALTSIQHFILKKDKYEAYTYLTQFANLIRSILKDSPDGRHSLAEEIGLLENYIALEQVRFEGKFDYTISIDNNISTDNIHLPVMLLQPYVENAIRHGFLHKSGKGHLELDFSLDGNTLLCTIQDDGIGRKASRKLKDEESHKSFAMNTNERRVELLNQMEKRDYQIEVEDLYDGDAAVGTRVVVGVPVSAGTT